VNALAFELSRAHEATVPPEARGLARDEVRLLVAGRATGALEHARFRALPQHLRAGDLLVVNVSATLPAAVPGRLDGRERVELRFATAAPDLELHGSWWIVELRSPDGARPYRGASAGQRVKLPGGTDVELVAPYAGGTRLWLARISGPAQAAPHRHALREFLAAHGHPIRYGHVPREWPLEAYQTVFATEPGSAEMPSAGRPFTGELITALAARGVLIAPLTLHTGVSSLERGEAPYPERYVVPEETARLVNAVRWWGGRVIAVGTTVVRALETVAAEGGTVTAGDGWTRLVVTPARGLRAIDGLVTGWHEPEASHLQLLEAAAGPELLEASYAEALEAGYLWHEFGDSHLLLP
jgi:S-adenosylmethionine:tRNA ribosyltransferase-isomerase